MILLIDIGNTNIVLGGMEGDTLCFQARMRSLRGKTADEYAVSLRSVLDVKGVDPRKIEGGILSSVVPELSQSLGQAAEELTGRTFLRVGTHLDIGFRLKMDQPDRVGADLLADTVGALALFQPPMVIFDMGTATTMTVIDPNGDYIGGLITPGLRLSMDALTAGTAQLPAISLREPPARFIGTNTVDCMTSGAIYGSAAMVDGLVDRVESELGRPVTVVATGGLMGAVAPYCRHEIAYREDLMLVGLLALYRRNHKD